MAYAPPRSVNQELECGMIDGAYKQRIKDRGGLVEHTTCGNLDDLSEILYGRCEAPVKNTPDGQRMTSMYDQGH